MYHYAANNPVKYVDPDGRIPFCVVTAGIGALFGAAHGAYNSYTRTGNVAWGEVARDALAGAYIGFLVGAFAAEAVTSTALTAGSYTASFGAVTGYGTASAGVGIASGLGATASTVSGMTETEIQTALSNLSRIQHAARHLIESKIFQSWNKNTAMAAKELFSRILSDPIKIGHHLLRGAESTTAYLGQSEGTNIVILIYDAGPMSGQIATSFIPTAEQLVNMGLQ